MIKLSALGDLVQLDGALQDIRRHHVSERIVVMTCPPYVSYMQRCPWVDEVFVDPRKSRFNPIGLYQLRKRLRRLSLDRVYDLQQVGRTRFYRHWLFPRVPWLGDAWGSTWFLRRPDDRCAADHIARHLALAGIGTTHTLQADVSWLADDVSALLRAAGVNPGFVLLIPGTSSPHDGKRWEHFPELADRLQDVGLQVVTVPGPAERELCRIIPGIMLAPADEGYYDVFTLAGVAKQAALVIGNDTGPTHLAAHLRRKGLALFGPHFPARCTGIQHTLFDWIESPCLAKLSVDEVWQRIEMIRASGSDGRSADRAVI